MQNSSYLGVPAMFLSISEQWCSLASAPKSLCPDSDTQYGVGTQGEASWNLLDSSCLSPPPPRRTQLWASAASQKTGCCCLPPPCLALSSRRRLVTSRAPASTGQVALGTGAGHSWVTLSPERGDSGALVSTGFRGKEGSVGPAVGLRTIGR